MNICLIENNDSETTGGSIICNHPTEYLCTVVIRDELNVPGLGWDRFNEHDYI